MSIKLSLVCPMYKVSQYIPDLIDSLLLGVNSQEVEIIFVDDCCPDGAFSVCESYIEALKETPVFSYKLLMHEKNSGPSAARNTGIRAASSSHFIGFIDADDVVFDNYWQLLSRIIDTEQADIIEFGYTEFSNSTELAVTGLSENKDVRIADKLQPFKTHFFSWSRIYQSKLVRENLFPVGILYEDLPFVARAFWHSDKILFVNTPLVGYRRRAGSTTTAALRNASYSQQLLNLVDVYVELSEGQTFSSSLTNKMLYKAFIILLKGARITPSSERQLFYQNCRPAIFKLLNAFEKYSLVKVLAFSLMKTTTYIGSSVGSR